mgnify:CR=1 FL=1
MDDAIPILLTEKQKLEALSLKYYQNLKWEPEAGHFYTTARSDLELYYIVKIENGIVFTCYTRQYNMSFPSATPMAEWALDGFTTEDFGPRRVWVPPFVLNMGVGK